jgi:cation diffusion facilitator family transporter
MAINVAISLWVIKIARKTDSVALLAEGKHLWADVLSSGAVLIGLVLVHFTGILILDPIVALIIGIIIAKESVEPLRIALNNIMDRKLPEEEQKVIEETVKDFEKKIVGLDSIRTRKSGSQRFIELNFTMPRNITVAEAHDVCHQIVHRIAKELDSALISTHIVPCTNQDRPKRPADCTRCQIECTIRAGK